MAAMRTFLLHCRTDYRLGPAPGAAALFPITVGLLLFAGAPEVQAISVDTLFVVTGEAAGDDLGSAVAAAGDVNGDGYADVIIGAHGNDAGGSQAGRAYLYYGGPRTDGVAGIAFTGTSAGLGLGAAVAAAGDVNGDGYADVIVGASDRAYVYYGGTPPDVVADLVLTRMVASEGFGVAVGAAGDWNGDGYDDVIVGAPADPCDIFGRVCQPGEGLAGSAYVYFGGPRADAVPDLVLSGEVEGDHFGASVGAARDVNGDGYADLIVGAPTNASGGGDAGRAYVYFGGPGADATADLVLTGAGEADQFGSSVGTAGDVNSDGYADIMVGAPFNSDDGEKAGRAYVYYGGPAADALADLTLAGEPPSLFFGVSVGTAGDVDGDGYADILAGSSHFVAGSERPGRVCVYLGGPSADASPDLVLTAPADDFFGSSVGTAGDVDDDGRADLVVGAHGSDSGGPDAGRAFVLGTPRALLAAALNLDPNVIHASGGGARLTAYIESSEFDPQAVDISSVRLAGSVPAEARPRAGGDFDKDGIPELMLKFSRDALLPHLVPGVNEVAVTGSLITGQRFGGSDLVRLVEPPRRTGGALVVPNPLNPAGTLTFKTSRPGTVGVQLFDLQGRLVRALLPRCVLPAGFHEVRIDVGGAGGGGVSSGVYFYRVDTPDGALTGRIAVLQ